MSRPFASAVLGRRWRPCTAPLWLVLCVLGTLPLLLLAAWLAYDTWRQYQQGLAQIHRSAEMVRSMALARTEYRFERAQRVLREVAVRPQVRALDGHQCDALLSTLPQVEVVFVALHTVDRAGRAVCGQPRVPDEAGARRRWQAALERVWQGEQSVGPPALQPGSGNWTVSLLAPVQGADGAIAGAAVLDLLLLDRQRLALTAGMPARTVIGVVDEAGRIMARSEQAEQRVNRPVSPANRRVLLSKPSGTFRATDFFGQPRLFAFAPFGKTPWTLFVSLDEEVVLAPLVALAWQRALLLLGLVAAMALGIALVARRVAQPVAQLLDTMTQVASGQEASRARPQGPREMRQIAQRLNSMLDAMALARQAARQSEERFRVAFLNSPNVHIICTLAEGRVLEVNDSFCSVFGWTRAEAVGRSTSELGLWQSAAERLQLRQRVRDDGACLALESPFRRRDGSTCLCQLSAHRITLDGQDCILAIALDLSARKASEAQLRDLAFTDVLSQLPNRRLLLDRLGHAAAQAERPGWQGALVYVDLDDFKAINESCSLAVGDQLLCEAAARLRHAVRPGDTVARLGGDEFVLLLENLGPALEPALAAAQERCHQLAASLRQPYLLDGASHRCTASIGVTVFGGPAAEPLELLKRAELAMYQAKAGGRDGLCFFDPRMQATVEARVAMERDLRAAIGLGQLQLYYQPQYDGKRLHGVEALVRWHCPQRGLVSPAEFIPLAEQTGLIVPLGRWVLHTACRQLALWQQRPGLADLTVAVNVSARQIGEPDFVSELAALLKQSGAPAARLKLELTENLLLGNVDKVIGTMQALRALGVGFELDDFGTGYSSLSYLKRLPLEQLKIDQSFVRDILSDSNDEAIARMVIALARSMGLEVLAEGVETEAQRAFLQALGCHRYQGYLFSRPLPLAAFEQFFADSSQAAQAG